MNATTKRPGAATPGHTPEVKITMETVEKDACAKAWAEADRAWVLTKAAREQAFTSLEQALIEEIRWQRRATLIATGMMFATSIFMMLRAFLDLFR